MTLPTTASIPEISSDIGCEFCNIAYKTKFNL